MRNSNNPPFQGGIAGSDGFTDLCTQKRMQNWYCAQAKEKLDDGWPESVEEQGLLLLVWRHHITKQYIKDVLYAVEKRSIKTI